MSEDNPHNLYNVPVQDDKDTKASEAVWASTSDTYAMFSAKENKIHTHNIEMKMISTALDVIKWIVVVWFVGHTFLM